MQDLLHRFEYTKLEYINFVGSKNEIIFCKNLENRVHDILNSKTNFVCFITKLMLFQRYLKHTLSQLLTN